MKITSRDSTDSNQTILVRRGRKRLLLNVLNEEAGFTLIELMVVLVTIVILASLAIPKFASFVLKLENTRAVSEIRSIEKSVIAYAAENQNYPNSLNDIQLNTWTDPWGNPYQYLNIENGGAPRQSQFLNDLNQHFDIYSIGPDGVTTQVITDPEGKDDIVRATDGGWVGLAVDF